jgi:5-methylthioadenosine/S-adenosylhomocysteine deaminase
MNLLIENAHILTMENFQTFHPGAIYIENAYIQAVGPTDEIRQQFRSEADEIIDASGMIAIPGLIDAHEHAGADRLAEPLQLEIDLPTRLKRFKWPLVCEASPYEIRIGAELAYLEAIRSGVTTTIMNYYAGRGINQEGVPKTAQRLGVRTVLARGYHDYAFRVPDKLIESADEIYHAYEQLFTQWHHAVDDRIQVVIAPVNLAYVDPQNLPSLVALAQKHDAGVHTHVSEVESVGEALKTRTGSTYVELLKHAGALGPKTQAAHAIYLTNHDIQLLADTGTHTVHCPTSNVRGAKGVCPVDKLTAKGINIALGSDTVEVLLVAIRQAAYLRKILTLDLMAITAKDVLQMATVNGAKAVGLGHAVGKLHPGYKADITLLSPNTVDIVPYLDPYSVVAYRLRPEHVNTVLVDGNIILRNGDFVNFDEARTLKNAAQLQEKLLSDYYS